MWVLDYKESRVPKNCCFQTVVLERTLENLLDCREINQSILKEISPEYSLEGLVLKLKLQDVVHLMRRTDSFKTLVLRQFEGRRRAQQASLTLGTWVWASSKSWWWTGRPGVLRFMGLQRVRHDWATELNWTVLVFLFLTYFTLYNRLQFHLPH